jgi:K(+)-stimulated pyrophosphate-energized sodium pump
VLRKKISKTQVQGALNKGNWVSLILTAIACYFMIQWMLPATLQMSFFGEGIKDVPSVYVFIAVLIGLVVGALISSLQNFIQVLVKNQFWNCTKIINWCWNKRIIAGLGVQV